MSTPTTEVRRASTRRRERIIAVAGATVAAALTWLIAGPVVGIELILEGWDGGRMSVTFGLVVVTALAAGLAGWAALAALERLTRRARPIWITVASIALIVSLGAPASYATTTSAAATLITLHLVVAAVLVPALARSAR